VRVYGLQWPLLFWAGLASGEAERGGVKGVSKIRQELKIAGLPWDGKGTRGGSVNEIEESGAGRVG